jgi:hypothetical protein
MRRLRSGWKAAPAIAVGLCGCAAADKSSDWRVDATLAPGDVRQLDAVVKPTLISTQQTRKVQGKGATVEVYEGLKRRHMAAVKQDVRLVVGAPLPTGSDVTGVGDLKRATLATPWDEAILYLQAGAALASVLPRPILSGGGGASGGGATTPVMPVIIYEDLETGADGTLLLVLQTDGASTPESGDTLCYVGLLQGGPGWILIPDDGGATKKKVAFAGPGPNWPVDQTRAAALRVQIEPNGAGGRKYTIEHVNAYGTTVQAVYNDGLPSDGPTSVTPLPVAQYAEFKTVAERMNTLIETLRLE